MRLIGCIMYFCIITTHYRHQNSQLSPTPHCFKSKMRSALTVWSSQCAWWWGRLPGWPCTMRWRSARTSTRSPSSSGWPAWCKAPLRLQVREGNERSEKQEGAALAEVRWERRVSLWDASLLKQSWFVYNPLAGFWVAKQATQNLLPKTGVIIFTHCST